MFGPAVFELMGIVGVIAFLAGVHQLWLAREEVFFWLVRFVRLFTATLKTRQAQPAPDGEAGTHKPLRTLHVVGGLGLVALGSFLVLISLTMLLVIRNS
ncbi:MAG TPA: hypothetical protein VNL38_01505 [Candidatus Nitrosotenuis sp.]|nr:hypothetical protein [Candidatus Nitrosotenuis sp.]